MAEIGYPVDRAALLLEASQVKEHRAGYGFRYEPYNFEPNPDKSICEQVLQLLDLDPADIEDVYFTGALTDPAKTDFFVEYKDLEGKSRRYTPNFVIRKKPQPGGRPGTGRILIAEIKR
jgi:hypothetical protein